MAVPKSKVSKARRGHRKSQWKLKPPTLVECPQCHVLRLPHRVCSDCGYYDGKKIIEIKEKKSKT
jgi:large subunit ribosomal protein L32